ncbi:hypothetical protein ACFZB5_30195 [Streptomyces nodosus]|uniref:hypothetical protein n=1 Tax=Streptomyces nodosus TaxID=40318 RepID=UPI0036F0B519
MTDAPVDGRRVVVHLRTEMTALADLVRGFAALLKPAEGNDVKLTEGITAARAIDLPHLRSLTSLTTGGAGCSGGSLRPAGR